MRAGIVAQRAGTPACMRPSTGPASAPRDARGDQGEKDTRSRGATRARDAEWTWATRCSIRSCTCTPGDNVQPLRARRRGALVEPRSAATLAHCTLRRAAHARCLTSTGRRPGDAFHTLLLLLLWLSADASPLTPHPHTHASQCCCACARAWLAAARHLDRQVLLRSCPAEVPRDARGWRRVKARQRMRPSAGPASAPPAARAASRGAKVHRACARGQCDAACSPPPQRPRHRRLCEATCHRLPG